MRNEANERLFHVGESANLRIALIRMNRYDTCGDSGNRYHDQLTANENRFIYIALVKKTVADMTRVGRAGGIIYRIITDLYVCSL